MQQIVFPNDIMIEITNNCNLNCATCYVHRDWRKKEFMTFDFFKKIIDQIPEKNEKTISLYNYWEPLLHKDIHNFIIYAKKSWIKNIKIATNWHYLTREVWLNLIKSWLDYISISIDWINQKSYENFRVWWNLNLVIKNIINFVKLRNKYSKLPIIEIQFIITSENYKDIEKIKILSKKLWVDILKLKRIEITEKEWSYLNPSWNFSRYKINSKKNYCNKPKESIVVNVDWKLLPCCYITDKYLVTHNLWNVKEKNIITLLKEKSEFINNICTNKEKISYCKDCNEWHNEIYYKIIRLNENDK